MEQDGITEVKSRLCILCTARNFDAMQYVEGIVGGCNLTWLLTFKIPLVSSWIIIWSFVRLEGKRPVGLFGNSLDVM